MSAMAHPVFKRPNFKPPTKRMSFSSSEEIESQYAIKEYEQLLRQIHPDFCKKLIRRVPEITPMELRICMLTRAFVGIKECARILSVSESSVETHRWHARCKLGIEDRGMSLMTALHAI